MVTVSSKEGQKNEPVSIIRDSSDDDPDMTPDNDSGLRSFFSLKSLKGRMLFSFLFIFLITGLAALAFLYSLVNMEGKIAIIESFDELNQKILDVRRSEKNFLLYGNKSDLVSALDELDAVQTQIERLRGNVPEKVLPMLNSLDIAGYSKLLHELARDDLSRDELRFLTVSLRRKGHEVMEAAFKIDRLAKEEIENKARRYKGIALVLLWGAIPIGALLSTLLANWILSPMQYIKHAVAKVMNGELSSIPAIPSDDYCVECNALIEAINSMLRALEAKQNQLLQSEKLAAIGKVTAGIAHEINNPLNNIFLTAEVLADDMIEMDDDERLEMVRDIFNEADRAREVVRHLLEFSRSRKPTSWEQVDLVDIVNRTLALLRNEFKIKQIECDTDFPKHKVVVLGNPNQLQQVFFNIILNGIQAMKPGGVLKVRISSHKGEEKATVEISDTGPGMSEDVIRQIFEPFFSTKSEGTGLGLSISYGIIKEHKGKIGVESTPGKGTKFSIMLPLWQ